MMSFSSVEVQEHFRKFKEDPNYREKCLKESLESCLTDVLDSAERFYFGRTDRLLFLKLGFNLFRKKVRNNVAVSQLCIAQRYIEDAHKEGYLPSLEFKTLLDRYNTLVDKVGGIPNV